MQFIDLAAQQRRISERLSANIARVLAHGQYINGPEVRELEERLAAYVGARHAVGCASGTDALLMALMALEIGPGDAVFTTPFTFVATAEVVSLLGATPVFADIDPVTFNLDPARLELAIRAVETGDPAIHPLPDYPGFGSYPGRSPGSASSSHSYPGSRSGPGSHSLSGSGPRSALRPRAVIPVDLFGLPADYDAIGAVAQRHGLAVIEDAAQSFGGEFRGKRAGAFGRIACTSFFPAKPLGAYGDAGMCFTDDDALAEALRSIRVHGQGSDKYDNVRIGINGRLDTLQAAILLAKFSIFPDEIGLRQEVAGRYEALLSGIIKTPVVPDGYKSAWAQYSLLARDAAERAALIAKLREGGVPTAIYYPKPLHCQEAFADLGYGNGTAPRAPSVSSAGSTVPVRQGPGPLQGGSAPAAQEGPEEGKEARRGETIERSPALFPVSEDCARRIFSLPMHPYLEAPAQRRIAALLSPG